MVRTSAAKSTPSESLWLDQAQGGKRDSGSGGREIQRERQRHREWERRTIAIQRQTETQGETERQTLAGKHTHTHNNNNISNISKDILGFDPAVFDLNSTILQ